MFPKPLLVTFDAFGTLFRPRASIAQLYIDYLTSHHSCLDLPPLEQVGRQFAQAFKTQQRRHPIYGRTTGQSPQSWWSTVIRASLHPAQLNEDAVTGLYNYFNSSGPYAVFDDSAGCLAALRRDGIETGVVSNSDPRLRDVLDGLGLGACKVAVSYETGFEKPEREAFLNAVEVLSSEKVDLNKVWHVGDERKKDLDGAVAAGINGVWVDRELDVLSSGEECRVVKDTVPCIVYVSSLEAVPKLFSTSLSI